METDKLLLYGGLAAAAYFVFVAPSSPNAASVLNPTGTTSLLPGGGALVGINGGYVGAHAATVSNYNQILAANPNIGNPYYTMTPAENSQYIANYMDLQQGLPSWIGQVMPDRVKVTSLSQAAQYHWKLYGCAEKRIFIPLQPPSTAPYIAPPANQKAASSGGGSWVSTAISVAGSVAIALLGDEDRPQLTDADCQLLFTSAAYIKEILPLYAQNDPLMVRAIETKLNAVLTQYS